MKTYKQPKPADSILANVKKIYSNVNLASGQLQHFVVALVRVMEQTTKKEIMTQGGEINQTVEYIFANSPRGMDRGTMAAWFVAYTPIRPRFNKGNAHYEGFGWARKGEFDVDGATKNPWYEADPEATREIKVPSVAKQIAALVASAAKVAAVTEETPESLAEMIKEATAKLEDDILAAMCEEKTTEWVERYQLSREVK